MADDGTLTGYDAEINSQLFPGYDTSATAGGGGVSGSGALGLGALALGGAGLGAILANGPSPLPPEFAQLTASVPGLQTEAGTLAGESAALTAGGTSTLNAAAAGQLTPEQQAQLDQYKIGLTNQTRQQFFGMGRNPDQDTAYIGQTADNDAKVNAMAQQQIQSSIALGLGEIQAGGSFAGQSLGFSTAANNALIAAGEAQVKADTAYSTSLTGAFSAIGSLFGAVAGGPAGAAVGKSVGGLFGSATAAA